MFSILNILIYKTASFDSTYLYVSSFLVERNVWFKVMLCEHSCEINTLLFTPTFIADVFSSTLECRKRKTHLPIYRHLLLICVTSRVSHLMLVNEPLGCCKDLQFVQLLANCRSHCPDLLRTASYQLRTVRNRLRAHGIRLRRPCVRPLLLLRHRRARLQWSQSHYRWRLVLWEAVLRHVSWRCSKITPDLTLHVLPWTFPVVRISRLWGEMSGVKRTVCSSAVTRLARCENWEKLYVMCGRTSHKPFWQTWWRLCDSDVFRSCVNVTCGHTRNW